MSSSENIRATVVRVGWQNNEDLFIASSDDPEIQFHRKVRFTDLDWLGSCPPRVGQPVVLIGVYDLEGELRALYVKPREHNRNPLTNCLED